MLMPGRPDVVHQADEHVFIEDLILATAIYAEAMMVLGDSMRLRKIKNAGLQLAKHQN